MVASVDIVVEGRGEIARVPSRGQCAGRILLNAGAEQTHAAETGGSTRRRRAIFAPSPLLAA